MYETRFFNIKITKYLFFIENMEFPCKNVYLRMDANRSQKKLFALEEP